MVRNVYSNINLVYASVRVSSKAMHKLFAFMELACGYNVIWRESLHAEWHGGLLHDMPLTNLGER